MAKHKGLSLDKFAQIIGERADLSDFERYLRHNLGRDQLISVVTLSSDLVTMPEVRNLYIQHFQELSTEAAFFSATNYANMVAEPSPDALAKFYQDRLSEYRLSDRVQVSYVKLDPTNFLADADQEIAKSPDLLAEKVDEEYQKRGTNYYPDLKPEEAKKRIVEEIRLGTAHDAARKKAEVLAEALYEMKPQPNLAVFAASNRLTLKTTAPFEEQTGPAEQDLGLNFARAAFALTPAEPIGEQPVADGDAFFLLALDKKFPAEILPLDRIHARVLADYKQSQALQLARRAGRQLAQSATNSIAQGKTFDAACAEAKVKPVSVPPISIRSRTLPEVEDHLSTYEYQRIAFNTPVGKVADFVETMDGGIVVYVRQLLPLDETKMKADLPEFYNTVRLARRQEAIIELRNVPCGLAHRETVAVLWSRMNPPCHRTPLP